MFILVVMIYVQTQHSILRNEAKNKDQNTIRKDSDTPRRYDEIAAASDIYLNLDKGNMSFLPLSYSFTT